MMTVEIKNKKFRTYGFVLQQKRYNEENKKHANLPKQFNYLIPNKINKILI